MKAIETVLILAWLVLSGEAFTHKVHKRILVSSNAKNETSIHGDPAAATSPKLVLQDITGNLTLGAPNLVGQSTTSIPVSAGNYTQTDIGAVVPIIEKAPVNTTTLTPFGEGVKHTTTEPTIEKVTKAMKLKLGNPDPMLGSPNQTYVLSVVIVPSIIPNDNDVHIEKFPTESTTRTSNISTTSIKPGPSSSSPLSENANTTLSSKLIPAIQPNDAIDISLDLTRFLGPPPMLKKESRKFDNATTSIISEVESEMGILFEFTPANTAAEKSENTNSSLPVLYNKTDTPKTLVQIDDVPFVEDFSPFFPLETFFGSMLIPQETIIIETDSELPNPSSFFPISVPQSNNSQLIKRLEREVLELPSN